MAVEFCDREPCPWLKSFIETLLQPPPQPNGNIAEWGETRFTTRHVTVVVHPILGLKNGAKPGVPRVVYFKYCPFCGTRIEGNEKVEEWVEIRRRLDDGQRSPQPLPSHLHQPPAPQQPRSLGRNRRSDEDDLGSSP